MKQGGAEHTDLASCPSPTRDSLRGQWTQSQPQDAPRWACLMTCPPCSPDQDAGWGAAAP